MDVVRIQCDVVTAKLLVVRGAAKWFCGCFMHSLIYLICTMYVFSPFIIPQIDFNHKSTSFSLKLV